MKETDYYADRTTVFYDQDGGEIAVCEVTIETIHRDNKNLEGYPFDFQTIAWCPDEECAYQVRKALAILRELDAWTEGDEKDRTIYQLVEDLQEISNFT